MQEAVESSNFIIALWESRGFLIVATIGLGFLILFYTLVFITYLIEHLEWHS